MKGSDNFASSSTTTTATTGWYDNHIWILRSMPMPIPMLHLSSIANNVHDVMAIPMATELLCYYVQIFLD